MQSMLALAPLAETAIFLAMASFGVSAVGTVLGVVGIVYRLLRPTGSRALPIALGLLAVSATFAIGWAFWRVNGDISLEDLAILILAYGLPLLFGAFALCLAGMRPDKIISFRS